MDLLTLRPEVAETVFLLRSCEAMPPINHSAVRSQFMIWQKANKAWAASANNPDEEVSDRCLDMVTEMLPVFGDLRAQNFSDILSKLYVWRDAHVSITNDLNELTSEDFIVVSVINDLERILNQNSVEFNIETQQKGMAS
jgi:hypothetical protein